MTEVRGYNRAKSGKQDSSTQTVKSHVYKIKRAQSAQPQKQEISQLQMQYLEKQKRWEEKQRQEREMQEMLRRESTKLEFKFDPFQPKRPGRPPKETEASWIKPEIDYDLPNYQYDGRGVFQILKKE